MYLLSFLPDWVFHFAVLTGIVGIIASTVISIIPVIQAYRLPLQILSIILLVVGVWHEGALFNQAAWEEKVSKLEEQIKKSESRVPEINTEVVTKYKTKVKEITTKGNDVVTYIDREVIKFDKTCPIPDSVIHALNAAALNKPINEDLK
jgi:c-di-AMP phosphodiesterase-like protein